MLQRASQYVVAKSLVAGKREDHMKSRGDKPQGQPFGTPRRRDRLVSTYHRIMKFPTRAGVGEVRSDPRESR
ncbi:hypothetical protein GW17_00041166 [Ensete ventricosum]|nr:hypothetical protein GW17_00041166 [Ensete ventricosum]